MNETCLSAAHELRAASTVLLYGSDLVQELNDTANARLMDGAASTGSVFQSHLEI